MTDRIRSLTVALTEDICTDAVEGLIDAIRRLRGVQNVLRGEPVSGNDWTTEQRIRSQVYHAVHNCLYPKTTERT